VTGTGEDVTGEKATSASKSRPRVAAGEAHQGNSEMFENLGPIDIECDAPPYHVVEACDSLGFQAPLDVRWCRASHLPGDRREVGDGLSHLLVLFGQSPEGICPCGQPAPAMQTYCCTFASGKESHYLLGQCRRCRTVFWDDAWPVPTWVEEGVVELTDPSEA
jgi:hypothetical protein